MICDKKKKLYEKYLTQFNHNGSLELANCFYVAYSMGYADSCEDAYSGSEKSKRIQQIEQDVNQMLISIKDFDKSGMEEAVATIIMASVNQYGINSVLSNLESRGNTPLIRWVIGMLKELKNKGE